jgi:LacI family transcriptional regulator
LSHTIYDIAREAGVSIATVSRVFNNSEHVSDKSRAKVLETAHKFGYHPQAIAQNLARKKSKLISVIVPVISNYFFMEVLEGIQDKLADEDYDLNIYNIKPVDNIFEQVENTIKRGMAEGYVIVSIHMKDYEWKALKRLNVPIALVDEYSTYFDSVSVDSVEGAYNATKWLINEGYKKIGMIRGVENSKPVIDRIAGYKRALEDSGSMVNDSLIVTGENLDRDGFNETNGYEAMCSLLRLDEPPDACISNSDVQAIGAMKAMQEFGIQLPILGFDDIQLSRFFGLSTMRQPMADMGSMAIEKLLVRIANKEIKTSHTVFSPELIHRQTSLKESVTL